MKIHLKKLSDFVYPSPMDYPFYFACWQCFFLIASFIITSSPLLRNYLPGYMNSEVRTQIVDNALRVDSLQQVLNKQNLLHWRIFRTFSAGKSAYRQRANA